MTVVYPKSAAELAIASFPKPAAPVDLVQRIYLRRNETGETFAQAVAALCPEAATDYESASWGAVEAKVQALMNGMRTDYL